MSYEIKFHLLCSNCALTDVRREIVDAASCQDAVTKIGSVAESVGKRAVEKTRSGKV